MSKILHVLNGDSTLHSFEHTGLEGDTMVWREVLSEGPVEENIASGHFWKMRGEWLCKIFGEDLYEYNRKVEEPLSKLYEPYNEIDLWFEFDLHCQVNMLGVIEMLSKHTDLSEPNIFLICPDSYPGKENFKGMGELNGHELEYLFDNIRVQLGEPDFVIAAEAWQAYTTCNAGQLEEYLGQNNYWANLHCLKPALQAHLKRLKVNEKDLNYIEQKLLDIYNGGTKDKYSIYEAFWQEEKIYGMGDLEINIYLRRLVDKGLVEIEL
jgi:hypothetical protein